MHDRDYYRALSSLQLLTVAGEDGINPEMAIALAEHLADKLYYPTGAKTGKFHFKDERTKTHA